MKHKVSVIMAVLALSALLTGTVYTKETELELIRSNIVASTSPVNGINYIDLNGDGIKDMVVSGYRSNISAHHFQTYSFYIYQKNQEEFKTPWGVVQIDRKKKESDLFDFMIFTHEGAEVMLSDIRLIKLKGEAYYQMVVADREFGKSYADEGIVTFNFYRLEYEEGECRYLFVKYKSLKTKDKYADVGQAFDEELK